MQPTAQAVGVQAENNQSPEGAKEKPLGGLTHADVLIQLRYAFLFLTINGSIVCPKKLGEISSPSNP